MEVLPPNQRRVPRRLEPDEIDPNKLAWMAGFFDGEGSVCILRTKATGTRRTPAYDLRISIGNTSEDALETFAQNFGAKIHTVRKQASTKQQYRWHVCGERAAMVLRALLPFLRVKHKQALLGLEYIAARTPVALGAVLTTPEEIALREEYYQKMLDLNDSHWGRKRRS